MSGRDKIIISKILRYCFEIKESHQHFNNDVALFHDEQKGFVYRNSIAMPVLQIGELAKNLSEEFRTQHSKLPWRAMIRMRDLFAHHYGSLDYSQLWDTSTTGISEIVCYFGVGNDQATKSGDSGDDSLDISSPQF